MKLRQFVICLVTVLLILLLSLSAIALAETGINFTAVLSANQTWILPGGQVEFIVELENTGDVDIDRIEIITPDAMLAGEYGSLPAGDSVSVSVPIIFDNIGEYPVELFIVGYSDEDSWTIHTNSLTITVSEDPQPSKTPEQLLEPTSEQTIEPEPDLISEQMAIPSSTLDPNYQVLDSDLREVSSQSENKTILYIIIGALSALIVIIIIIIVIILQKRRKQK